MTDEQDVTLLLGWLARCLDRPGDGVGEMYTLHPDQIELRSPWTGRAYVLQLKRLREPPPPDWVPEGLRDR